MATVTTNVTILHDIDYQNDSVLDQYDQHERKTIKQSRNKDLSKNRLDLYLPNRDKSDLVDCSKVGRKPPLVVYVHGGGWRRGDRRQWRHFISSYDTNLLFAIIFRLTRLFDNIGEAFARNKIACAVISYPLQQPHIVVTLLELFLSFFMSTLVSTSFFAFLMLLIYLCVPMSTHSFNATCIYTSEHRKFSIGLKTFMSICLLLSQLFTWSIIVFNIKHYKNGLPKCMLFSIPATLSTYALYTWYNTNFHTTVWTLSILLTLSLQISIAASQIYHNSNSKNITCEDQIKAVARSLQWLKTFGDKTDTFDSCKIVLSGHSAGSHLINMLIWNDKYFHDMDLSKRDVKGIISLSGVHNLESINRGLTRRLYLSTFGRDHDVWENLSPINHVTMRNATSSPEFLIITAEHDFDFLKKDGRDYVEKLEKHGYKVCYDVIPSCNHLSLPMNFGSSTGSVLETICLDFVERFR